MPALWNPLLDPPAFPADRYRLLADRLGKLLNTQNDVLLVQGEAIVALEAVALGIGRPGRQALNIVTSPYGGWFGEWLRRGGAEVRDLVAEPGKPITVDAVKAALASGRADIISLVHAESASGILNPLPDIAELARENGALLVVDAVASVGGHKLDVDALGVDVAVIGPQKSLGGSAGVSALSVSDRAWAMIESGGAPNVSAVSLLDLKHNWLDRDRGPLPGMPSALEFFALEAALDRIEGEGLNKVIARHTLAGTATRAGLRALGLSLWVDEYAASNLVTAGLVPEPISIADLIARTDRLAGGIAPGVGPGTERLVRLNHTGPRARFETVLANVVAFGEALNALGTDVAVGAAAEAVARSYSSSA
jgi:aspartate aminotransferase-like enzyme